jgi:hypothetical protein
MRKLLPILLLLCASPASATWTCAQGGPGCTDTAVRVCDGISVATCNITVVSTHAHAVEAMCGNIATSPANLTASTTDGTWVVSTASKGIDSTLVVVSECEYNLNATGGATTITCTFSVSASIDCEFFEFTGTGSSFTFDKGANVDDSTSCTTCAAANLGPLGTSNNYILVQSAFGGATVTALIKAIISRRT